MPVSEKGGGGGGGVAQSKIYGIASKFKQFIYTLVCTYIFNIRDPSQSGSSDILFTRLFLNKMPMSKKGE